MNDLISINQAVIKGITKLRMDHWASAEDHIELYIDRIGKLGPWVKLWSPYNELSGQDNPQTFLITVFMKQDLDNNCWREYDG